MCLLHLSRRTPPGDHKCCCHLCTGASLSRCSSAGTGEFTRGRCELVARPTDVLTLSALCSPCVPRRRPNKQISCQRRDSSPQASRLRLQPARTHRCVLPSAQPMPRCSRAPEGRATQLWPCTAQRALCVHVGALGGGRPARRGCLLQRRRAVSVPSTLVTGSMRSLAVDVHVLASIVALLTTPDLIASRTPRESHVQG